MKKHAVTILLIIIIFFSTLHPTAFAVDSDTALYPDEEEAVPAIVSIRKFLDEMEMDFDYYISMIRTFAEAGEYLHFLEINAARYEEFQRNNPDIPLTKVIALVNVNFDKGSYNEIMEVPDIYCMALLVNHNFALPSGWTPSDLVSYGSGHRMREEVVPYFDNMRDSMIEAGLSVHVIRVYRPYNEQRNAHSRAVGRYGQATADRNWARAGHSEHQAGFSIDLLHRPFDTSMHNARFQDSTEFTWLTENAHKYGFILRYPYENREFHRFVFEPWHWRFVGIDIATAMYNDEIALFEVFYGTYLAPDVLYNVRAHILEQEALAEAEELARLAELEAAAEADELARIAELEAVAEVEEPIEVDSQDVHYIDYYTPFEEYPHEEYEHSHSLNSGATLLATIICAVLGAVVIVKKKRTRK